ITLIKRMGKEELPLSEAARRMGQLPVDGMIFNLAQMVDDFAEYRSPVGLRTVIITPFEHATCSTVSDDQEGAARAACRRLIELGHRHIRFIAGTSDSLASKNRERGWRLALDEAGLAAADPLHGDWSADSGYEAGAILAQDQKCTAILACNDNMANGAMQALNDAGRRVPDDVSIIGFDDSLTDSVPHTILSSIRFDHQKLGARAFEEVLGASDEKHRILIPGALIERGSIRPRS
ncbi:MAG: substrate-binding domain-containing protein, partial [Bifidobacterium ruminantium]|nr:substrate-binding domain-containing protein [Bifidobacterium ruminantium]